ncbi:MAG: VOC family protein [Chloroflexi bacterium]|nr:VOC family protein [Chloroflexota bacterium]
MEAMTFMVNITSEQPEVLGAFYRDVVGLPQLEGMGPQAFLAGGTPFMFDGHSEVHGKAKEPQRYLMSLRVKDVAAEEARLKAAGVTFIRSQGTEAWGGTISTFLDPDGNYMQLIQWEGD